MKLKKTLPEALLTTFLIRLLITGAHVGDAIAIIALAALLAYENYLEHIKIPDPQKEMKDKLSILEGKLDSVANKIGALTAFRTK